MRRPWTLPLVPLYWGGLRVKNALFDSGVSQTRKLDRPVVSVGSVSAGGAGKTPVVLILAELLAQHGVGVDVLSRGYGRGSSVVEEVAADGEAVRFGDEPLEMTRRGVKVFVGADRFAAGTLAELQPTSQMRDAGHPDPYLIHLLDDGFQHRRLARNLDIVLLTREDMDDWLLPAGNLREPLSSLKRADVVVVRDDEAAELAGVIAAHSTAEVWMIRRELTLPSNRLKKPLVFCGIARPESFLSMLPNIARSEVKLFPDHHAYSDNDFKTLAAWATQINADGFITTAKDAVKIPPRARQKLEAIGPLLVAELRVSLTDEARALATLKRTTRLA